MYELADTIVAVSSPSSGARSLVRISGPEVPNTVRQIFEPHPAAAAGLFSGTITIDTELKIDALLYLFSAPRSYTGEHLAEIHLHTNPSVTEALIDKLLSGTVAPVRAAGPGEFTARAYLNGKIDLAQAEAVNEIITSSNKLQLAAAEKLLAGRLAQTTSKIRSDIMDSLSLLEAALDFSQHDIEFISRPQAVQRLEQILSALDKLLTSSISYESMVDLPAVGIAGLPNAGKSSLLNRLLGRQRSIVSAQLKTTRDVLTGVLTLAGCRCVLFDCAGLMTRPDNILDKLAQQAATEALKNACIVILCVDISKSDFARDIAALKLIESKTLIAVAAKSDLLSEDKLSERLAGVNKLFGADFLPISSKTGLGIETLRKKIDKKLIEETIGQPISADSEFSEVAETGVSALTSRHKQAVTEAIENIKEAVNEVNADNDEVAAMMLRAAYHAISNIEQQNIDEQILENIFGRFCIGK